MTEATMPRHPTTIRLEVERAFADHRLIEYSCWEIEELERKLAEERQEHQATLSLAREALEEIERLNAAISEVTNERDELRAQLTPPAMTPEEEEESIERENRRHEREQERAYDAGYNAGFAAASNEYARDQ